MSSKTTRIANLDHVVAWDDSEQRHVYLDSADLVFKGNEVVHVGPGYAGPVDTTIEGRGFMAIPGLINVRSHPFSEPANKGLTEEYGSDKLGQSSLYEYLTVFGLNPEDAGPSTQVALSELLKSGVTTITDLSMAREGWVDDLAKTGMRAVLCPMMRQGVWFTKNGHTVDYAWDEKAGEKAFDASMKTIDAALKHPSGRLGGMVGPAQIDTCRVRGTGCVLMVNRAVVSPAGTTTCFGRDTTAGASVPSPTPRPPGGAGQASVTRPVTVPPPTIRLGSMANELTGGTGFPAVDPAGVYR